MTLSTANTSANLYGPVTPNFMIVGAMKCGTSYMAEVLAEHPQVCFSRLKEPQYFTTGFRNSRAEFGPAFYASQFAHHAGEPRIGEGSATYFSDPEAAARIHAAFGPIRIVICLRDPVARTISHYRHFERFGEILPPLPELLHADTAFGRELRLTNSYGTNTKRFVDLMGADNVRVFLQEDLRDAPAQSFARLAEFLDLDAFDPATFARKVNEARAPRSRVAARLMDATRRLTHRPRHALQAVMPGVYKGLRRKVMRVAFREGQSVKPDLLSEAETAHLRAELAPEIELLESLIDRDLSHWKPE